MKLRELPRARHARTKRLREQPVVRVLISTSLPVTLVVPIDLIRLDPDIRDRGPSVSGLQDRSIDCSRTERPLRSQRQQLRLSSQATSSG